jgi:hypothetical protein
VPSAPRYRSSVAFQPLPRARTMSCSPVSVIVGGRTREPSRRVKASGTVPPWSNSRSQFALRQIAFTRTARAGRHVGRAEQLWDPTDGLLRHPAVDRLDRTLEIAGEVHQAQTCPERLPDALQVGGLDREATLREHGVRHPERQGVLLLLIVLPGGITRGQQLVERGDPGTELAPVLHPVERVHLGGGATAGPGPRHREGEGEGDAGRREDDPLLREIKRLVLEPPITAVPQPRGRRIGVAWPITVTFAGWGRSDGGSARPAAGGSRVLVNGL